MNNTSKLMEMYKSTFQPALAEGEYKVVMLSHKYTQNPAGTGDYIRFEYAITEGASAGRVLSDNRFEAGLGVMVSHLREQLGREKEAVVPVELFNEVIANKTEITIWVKKRVVNGSQKTNIHFKKPLEETVVANTTVVDDTIENNG
jgi:hypothetical protein